MRRTPRATATRTIVAVPFDRRASRINAEDPRTFAASPGRIANNLMVGGYPEIVSKC
jgi:hypothetical protein